MIGVGIHAWTVENLGGQRVSSLNGHSEAVDLKPEKDAVAVWLDGRIAQMRMVVDVPGMELEDELPAVIDELLVLGTSMPARAAEQALIPAAAGLDVSNRDQGLRLHRRTRSKCGRPKL